MRTLFFIFIFLALIATLSLSEFAASEAFSQPDETYQEMDIGVEAASRGRAVFMEACNSCHGLKYLREGASLGLRPIMDPGAAKEAFGVEPPDLSLMASARGRGKTGARYIQRLLTTYYTDEDGRVKNRAFGEETQGDGTIAMPQPLDPNAPDFEKKTHDVAVFLLHVASPEAEERRSTGAYVLIYMAVLTMLLYALNKATWKGIKKR